MHFQIKNILKNKYNYTFKDTLKLKFSICGQLMHAAMDRRFSLVGLAYICPN